MLYYILFIIKNTNITTLLYNIWKQLKEKSGKWLNLYNTYKNKLIILDNAITVLEIQK
jgi:hypothetical protein